MSKPQEWWIAEDHGQEIHVIEYSAYEELRSRLDVARETLESISKNSCCETCQEAKLVALSALEQIRKGGE